MSHVQNAVSAPSRPRWVLAVIAIVSATLLSTVAHIPFADAAAAPGGQFVAVTPTRIVDTKTGLGGFSTPFGADTSRSFKVLGVGGVPSSGVSAVVLGVAVTSATANSVVDAFPAGADQAAYSFLRFGADETPVSNTTLVAPGANGSVTLRNSAGSTNLRVDIEGYFTTTASAASAGYHPLGDFTRVATSVGSKGGVGPNQLSGSTGYAIPVAGVGAIPDGATAVFANVRVNHATTDGQLRVGPNDASFGGGQPQLNFQQSIYSDQGMPIDLGADGKLKIQALQPTTMKFDITIDVMGYFVAGDNAGGEFHPINGVGLYEGRTAAQALDPGTSIDVRVAGVAGIPKDQSVSAVAVTLIASRWTTSTGGTISVFNPDDGANGTSSLGYDGGDAGQKQAGLSSTAIVPISDDGTIRVKNNSNTSSVEVALAAQGWFGAPTPGAAEASEAASAASGSVPLTVEESQHIGSDPACVQAYKSASGGSLTDADVASTCSYDHEMSTTIVESSPEEFARAVAGSQDADADAATRPSRIWKLSWKQSAIGVNWKEVNSGVAWFDKHGHVWAMHPRWGYGGSHTCQTGYSVIASISHDSCDEQRRYDLTGAGGHPISEWDHYTVNPGPVFGIGGSFGHTQHVNIYANGKIFKH